MNFKIDLHVHSKYSEDNDADPEETVLYAIDRGLNGVAFTEHDSYAASEFAEELREKYQESILIFRGVELTAEEGHCLIFGVDPDTLGVQYAPLSSVVRLVNEAGGVVVPAHPFRPGSGVDEVIRTASGIVAVEGCNGVNKTEMNARAIEVAKALKLPYTGGSDAHESENVGRCYTSFNREVTYENFIDMLKAGNYRGVDMRTSVKIAMNSFLL